ncbi:HNH endonuclease signature motif containing protein [Nocardioides dilutus]
MVTEFDLSGDVVVTDHVDDAEFLGLVGDSELQSREADRRKLRFAREWALRKQVSDVLKAAHWCDGDIKDIEETIGGEGTPLVAAGCVEPFAVALGVSTSTALQLLSDALDLYYRLPRLWALMEALDLAPWRARRIAKATHGLSPKAAAYVEAQVLEIADSCGPVKLERIVNDAAARFDPVERAEVEDAAKASWGVRVDDYTIDGWVGTSRMELIGDTPTLHRFRDLLSKGAHDQLDPSRPAEEQPSLEHRKIAALNSLISATTTGVPTTAYLHFDLADLPDKLAVGAVERLGPLTIRTIKEWLGTSRFTLQPVLRMDRTDAVDQHDPPAWMRETVVLRDPECVFPWCTKGSRGCDLDHIEAYVEMDDGGPPGQTRPDNLAPLCRRHHRAKTFRGWSYTRDPDGSYSWTSPHGRRFVVDGDRVTRL